MAALGMQVEMWANVLDRRLTPAQRRKYGLGPKQTVRPSSATLTRYMRKGTSRATDGCTVVLGGDCKHGAHCWALKLGVLR